MKSNVMPTTLRGPTASQCGAGTSVAGPIPFDASNRGAQLRAGCKSLHRPSGITPEARRALPSFDKLRTTGRMAHPRNFFAIPHLCLRRFSRFR
jgi:hypothetical protein